jgi:hypothetical protein
MRGEYKVKHPGLRPRRRWRGCSSCSFDDVTFEHIRREQNAEADRLSNVAMDISRKREKGKGKEQL